MNEQQIEIFSLESFIMNGFALALAGMGFIQFLGFIFPSRFQRINDRFDRFIEWVHQSCEILPWLLFASFIAIVTPIYDILLDSAWIASLKSEGPEPQTLLTIWRKLLNEESDINSKRDLIHSIQWITAIGMFYFYSISWMRFVELTKMQGTYPVNKLGRGVFFGGFAILIGFVSSLVSKMGQNANFVLL